MSNIYFPEASKVQGTTKIAFLTTVASAAAVKIATEIKATSSVEGTMVIRAWAPTTNVNSGNSPARLGTTVQMPQEGNAQLQPIPIAFPFDPAKPDSDANNKLKALLVEGTELYAVVRRGTDVETDWTLADLGDCWHVRVGHVDDDARSGDDEFAEYEVHLNLIPLSPKVPTVLAA